MRGEGGSGAGRIVAGMSSVVEPRRLAPIAEANASTRADQRIRLMGMPIDPLTGEQVISTVLRGLAAGRGGWVITPNLDQLRSFRREPELRPMFDGADLVLADGMPLVWASRVQRTPLPERVAGSDLIGSLTKAASRRGRSVFMLGGNPGAAELAAERLCELNPRLRVAGVCCPPRGFEHHIEEIERIAREIEAARPDIVYVGLGFPKQEQLIARMRASFPAIWFLGVGVSLSFVGGDIERAPGWMQGAGLEWLHRLVKEPRRLFRRYVVHGMPFALNLMTHAAVARVLPRRASRGGETLPA